LNTLTTYNNTTTAMVTRTSGYQATLAALSTGVVSSFNLAFRGGNGLVSTLYDKATALLRSSERMAAAGLSAYIHF